MNIYIMRHGQAEMMANSDAERPLTSIGRLESEKMASYLANRRVTFDAVMVSPYKRAQQTWDSVRPFFSEISNVQIIKALTPSGSARKSVDEVLALQAQEVQNLLIVSHLPLVGYIIGELVPSAGVPAFATSSVGHVRLDQDGFGHLVELTSVMQINQRINLS